MCAGLYSTIFRNAFAPGRSAWFAGILLILGLGLRSLGHHFVSRAPWRLREWRFAKRCAARYWIETNKKATQTRLRQYFPILPAESPTMYAQW